MSQRRLHLEGTPGKWWHILTTNAELVLPEEAFRDEVQSSDLLVLTRKLLNRCALNVQRAGQLSRDLADEVERSVALLNQ